MANTNSTKYAMSASKGFSYLVPIAVQATLTKLLKKLPTPARPIYREYYGDLMASRACARDSANAMVEFVQKNFPIIKTEHNRLAKLMNKEIDQDEHDGYEPVRFPVIGFGSGKDVRNEVEIEMPQTRKHRAASPAPRKTKVRKIAKPSQFVLQPVGFTPPPETPAEWSHLPRKPTSASVEPRTHTLQTSTHEPPTDDVEDTQHEPNITEPMLSRPSSSEEAAVHIAMTSSAKELGEEFDEDEDHNSDTAGTPDPWDDSLWPYGKWVDGLEVIDAFPWDKPGSRWEPGRGLVSVHYEEVPRTSERH